MFSIFLLSGKLYSQSCQPVGGGTNAWVRTLCVFNDTLFAGGDFISAGGVPVIKVAKWNGSNWYPIATPANTPSIMIVYNGELFEGGSMGFSKWTGTSWASVGSGGPSGHVYALEVFNNKLYLAGTGPIYQWDGSSWTIIGNPSTDVYSLCAFKGELYAGGAFNSINGVAVSHIAKWNGSAWSALGIGILGGSVGDMASYNNELYVSGSFTSSAGNPSDYITKWNGSSWAAVGTGASAQVIELDSINGNLYIGGEFSSISSVNANGIAFFDGVSWNPMGTGINSSAWISTITEFQNSIYIGGTFTVASGNICLYIAEWNANTGIADETYKNNLLVFPNPFCNSLTIKVSDEIPSEIFLYDITLRKIFEQKFTKSVLLNTEQLTKGIYMFQIKNNRGIIKSGRLVKE